MAPMNSLLSSSMPTKVVPWIACVAAVFSGCADPEGAFNDFKDRYQATQGQVEAGALDGAQGDGAACVIPTADDVKDPYLFALSANVLTTKPIVCLGTLTITKGANGPEISFSLQPLVSKDRRTPTGDPIVGGPYPIHADGSFEADFGGIKVNGEANPISGSSLETTAKLTGGPGTICKPADFMCGAVSGQVTVPASINLAEGKGSKFTFQRITDPNQYPAPMIDCAGTTVK
jgi:hypothetical protein